MKRSNKKGFTLVEIIAAVTILGILSLLGIMSVNNIIKRGKIEHYKTTEKNLRLTAESYAVVNRDELPKNIGGTNNITARTLVEENYIEDVKDYYDKSCDLDETYVQIYKYSKTGYSYLTHLNCSDYTNKTTVSEMKPVIEIEMPSDSNNVSQTKAKIKITDENKLLSYSITVYKYNTEVYVTGDKDANYSKEVNTSIDLSKYTPGDIKIIVKATNIFGQTATKTATTKYTDKKGPQCIVKAEDASRTDEEWITTTRKITVGCDDGEEGSGCTREEFTKTFKTDAKMGTITIEDKAGNKTNCTVAVYIDKTPPTCTVTPSGTAGINGWWKTQNVTMTLETNKGSSTQSPIASYDLTTSQTPTYAGTTKTKTQTNTSGTIWYGYVKDKAGNVNNCQSSTIKVDTNAPTCSVAASGTAGDNGWWKTNNATITLTTNDTGPSTVGTYDLTTSSSATYVGTTKTKTQTDTTGTTWYGYVKDKAGNIGNCSLASVKVDTKVPTCTVKPSGTAGENGWYRSNATLTLTTSDTGGSTLSGYNLTTSTTPSYGGTSKTATQTNTAGTTWYGYVKDKAGNIGNCNSGTVKVDTVAPTCSISLSGSHNGSFYVTNVGVSLNRNDTGTSGLAKYGMATSSSVNYNSKTSATQVTVLNGITWYGFVKDTAGNTGTCNSGHFVVKASPPTISFSLSGSTSTAICRDGTTGAEIRRWTKSVGNSTHTVTCTDSYGLSKTCSQSYTSSTYCAPSYSCACTGCCGTCKSGWCYCCCNYCGEDCSTTVAKSGGTSCN